MTTTDIFHIAATIVAILAAAVLCYQLHTTAKAETRAKIEHDARMVGYAAINADCQRLDRQRTYPHDPRNN